MSQNELKEIISNAILEVYGSGGGFNMPDFSVEAPENPAHGDYATNAAMALAKILKQKPMDIATALAAALSEVESLKIGGSASVEIAAPGFINFRLADDFVLKSLAGALKNPQKWGEAKIGAGKTFRVEYFQLNIAKRPHVGHVRSAILGDAIKRVLLALGFKAVSDTHVGDWGTQFGILLYAFKNLPLEKQELIKKIVEKDPFRALEVLEQLYIGVQLKKEEIGDIQKKIGNFGPDLAQPISELIKRHSFTGKEAAEFGKVEFAKLERGDKENRKIWKWMVDVSMKKVVESAKQLGLLPFEMHCGESFYEKMMPEIVELALEKGVAKKLGDGAVVVNLSAEGLDEAVLIKSDGASTYLLRDLATIQYMKKKLKYERNLYVVDVRQSLHFKHLFRMAEILGIETGGEGIHINYGFITSPQGAMSTRKGTVISLDDVLDEAKKKALGVITDKNPELKNAEKVAEAVGLGALKFFILAHHRKSDIVFRWEEALAFEGDTGPYLQYTHARLKSILRKARVKSAKIPSEAVLDQTERRIAVAVLRFPEAVENVIKDYTSNVLTNYLYNLSKLANEFYHSHPVTQETDAAKKQLRIALVAAVALTLAKGLNLLGIEAPEEM